MSVILAMAAAVLLQDDWSAYTSHRDLAAEEIEEAQRSIQQWLVNPDVAELQALAGKIRVTRADEMPVYRVLVETAIEGRTLVRVRKPSKGMAPRRTVEKVDPWILERPAYDGWDDASWMVPVEGTAEQVVCDGCAGDGSKTCSTCSGGKRVPCPTCRGSGRTTCGSCSGGGSTRCSPCGGSGSTGIARSRRSCTSCGGSGRRRCTCSGGSRNCSSCSGGRTTGCRDCQSAGEIPCRACESTGFIVQSLSVRITISIAKRPERISLLASDWRTAETGKMRSASGEAMAAKITSIRDLLIRDPILECVKRQADLEHVLRQRVWMARDVAVLVAYEVAGRPYECVISGGRITARVSPVTEWAARMAASARESYTAGKIDQAMEDALAALRVDPDCLAAKAVVDDIERRREEARAAAEAVVEREKALDRELLATARRSAEFRQLAIILGAIALGVLTFFGIVVWRVFRRNAWDGGIRTR